MVGSAAAAVVGSFLPWASTVGTEGVNGFATGPSKITALTGILLGLYRAQGLRRADPSVRHHGWAIAALVATLIVIGSVAAALDELDSLTLGVADVEYSLGLMLAVCAALFAIRPLVQLRKDAKRREHEGTITQVAPAATPAGWYADPLSRHERRYYDGAAWTEHMVDGETRATDPLVG